MCQTCMVHIRVSSTTTGTIQPQDINSTIQLQEMISYLQLLMTIYS